MPDLMAVIDGKPFPPNGGHDADCAYVGGVSPNCTCSARCDCGEPVPEGRIAYCSDACRLADKDHGPDEDGVGGEES